ncbi:hypothetical protein AAFF_G00230830 [Aldrovandia affinis]|uniref:Uncharacterized protein n=1 Tax=Aldrovandia affinis TaxID=143900 RepID=A0AAD7RF59_9TELE|nr:hypothetical protein AAFF_G00230830 [Aldrovandia affinis]
MLVTGEPLSLYSRCPAPPCEHDTPVNHARIPRATSRSWRRGGASGGVRLESANHIWGHGRTEAGQRVPREAELINKRKREQRGAANASDSTSRKQHQSKPVQEEVKG